MVYLEKICNKPFLSWLTPKMYRGILHKIAKSPRDLATRSPPSLPPTQGDCKRRAVQQVKGVSTVHSWCSPLPPTPPLKTAMFSSSIVIPVVCWLICLATAQSADQTPAATDLNSSMLSFQSAGLVPQILAKAPANLLEVDAHCHTAFTIVGHS